MDPYKKLANHIIKQAVKDWRAAMKKLQRHPVGKKAKKAQKEIDDTETFFLSGWFDILTNVDGEKLLSLLRKEFTHDS